MGNYAKPAALKSVLDQGADFIVRVGWSSLRLLQADGTLVVGAAAFVQIWSALPRWTWLARFAEIRKAAARRRLPRPARPLSAP